MAIIGDLLNVSFVFRFFLRVVHGKGQAKILVDKNKFLIVFGICFIEKTKEFSHFYW